MRIEQIELKNCQSFQRLLVHFSAQHLVTVILAEHGAGKTALLKHMFHALTWFVGRYKDQRSAGVVMPDLDIRRGQRQSKISISVRVSAEIASLPESPDAQTVDRQLFTWHLWKTLNASGVGMSQVDTAQLETLTQAYQTAVQKDPLLGAPLIAYYPAERFMSELNLLSKNNPAVLHAQAAYDLSSVGYTNFARFFEWFREVSDIEHAQQAQFVQGLVQALPLKTPDQIITSTTTKDSNNSENSNPAQHLDQAKDTDTEFAPKPHSATNSLPEKTDISSATDAPLDVAASLQQRLIAAQSQLQSRCLNHLNHLLQHVFPEIDALYLQYHPKLELMVRRHGQPWLFQQLPSHLKVGISLLGDLFRRACLLHPHSAFPHLEVEGVVMIDQIDQQLDPVYCSHFLRQMQLAFPRLQFIVTGLHRELLEHAEHWQCLQLRDGQVHPLNLTAIEQQWQMLYQNLSQPNTITESNTELLDPMLLGCEDASLEQLWLRIQQLSPEQLAQLKHRLDNDSPSAWVTSTESS